MKQLYIYSLVLAGSLFMGGCSDLLNIEQHGVMPIEEFYQTDDQVIQANADNYNAFINNSDYSQQFQYYYIALNEMLGNDMWAGGNGSRGDFAEGEMLNEYTFTTENSFISAYYGYLYDIIFRANVVLDKTEEGKSRTIDMCRAEAKVFRSWANFELASMWGTAPLITHCLTADEYQVANSAPGELYAQIEKDLGEAISSGALSEKKSADDNLTWRITKQFAQALLGKTLLWEGKYQESAAMLENVIQSGKYALFQGAYGDQWRMANKYNPESVFEINRVSDPNKLVFGFVYTYYSWSTQFFTNLPPGMQSTGWGWAVPQKGLYDAFTAWEGDGSYRRTQTVKSYEEVNSEFGTRALNGTAIYQDRYFVWKTRYLMEDTVYGMTYFYCNNFHIMRYAEVLLLAAEAQFKAGNESKALEYVNQIRSRAQLSALSSLTMDTIKKEKRLELCLEEINYKDLIRWGDAYEAMKDQGSGIPFMTVNYASPDSTDPSTDVVSVEYRKYNTSPELFGFKKGKHELLPFPASECRANPNIVQNPGY